MKTTIGELISTLFGTYDRSLGDEELAAVATEIRLAELLAQCPSAPRRTRGKHRRAR